MLLTFLAIYFFFSFWKRDLKIKQYQIRIPEPKIAFLQLALSSIDYLLSGSIIYFLLPSNPQLTLLHVLVFFALAQLIGLISTVPGGLGVFETLMLFMLEPYFDTVDIIRLFCSSGQFTILLLSCLGFWPSYSTNLKREKSSLKKLEKLLIRAYQG